MLRDLEWEFLMWDCENSDLGALTEGASMCGVLILRLVGVESKQKSWNFGYFYSFL